MTRKIIRRLGLGGFPLASALLPPVTPPQAAAAPRAAALSGVAVLAPKPPLLMRKRRVGAPHDRGNIIINRPHRGNALAPVVVLCDVQSAEAQSQRLPMALDHLDLFATVADSMGLTRDDFLFIGIAPPYAEEDRNSASRKWKHVEGHAGIEPGPDGRPTHQLRDLIYSLRPQMVVTLGEMATRVMVGRAVKITKARGIVEELEHPVTGQALKMFPMLSPGFVARLPEHRATFAADMGTLRKLKDHDWTTRGLAWSDEGYEWITDWNDELEAELVDAKAFAVDTEGTGLTWHDDAVRTLVIQITPRVGRSLLIPLPLYAEKWFPDALASGGVARAVAAVKRHLEGEKRKVLHNAKFDVVLLRKEGIEMQAIRDDTQLLAFCADENMMSKGLADCIRVFVPEMGGYSDGFDTTVDKSRMIDVPPEDVLNADGTVHTYGMRRYAGGDTDATYRLAMALYPLVRAEPSQMRCYERIMMPGIMAFANRVERFGMLIDQTHLAELTREVGEWLEEEFAALIALVPAGIRRKYVQDFGPAGAAQKMVFSRPDFVREVLFTDKKGFRLKPVAFTKSTEDLVVADRVASTSAKDHLTYFVAEGGAAGEFVNRLISFQQTQKMMSTYLVGFPKYIATNGRIYPSYMLHNTNTGRTASNNPNGQNFPKRGRWAKPFLRTFQASPGYVYVCADLSQAELRIAAWEAMDPTMLRIYREDGDIHAMTAASTMRWDIASFNRMKGLDEPLGDHASNVPGVEEYLRTISASEATEITVKGFLKLQRFRAKAVNFGFVYGMGAEGFRIYAKTQYGVDYTSGEASDTRDLFFRTYSTLTAWHDRRRAEVRRDGKVTGLLGAVRHLPSIRSADRGMASSSERQAINAPVQRLGSDIGLIALTRIAQQTDPSIIRPIGFVHDQVITEVKLGHQQEMLNALVWAMEDVSPMRNWFGVTPPLPFRSDPEVGGTLGTLKEQDDWAAAGIDLTLNATKPQWWNDDEEGARAAFERQMVSLNIRA
jgi:DNA polymerase I-like protein with 3'-5' exonuclease and polymerase domains